MQTAFRQEPHRARCRGVMGVLALSILLGACSSESGPVGLDATQAGGARMAQRPPDLPGDRPERPQFPVGVGCGWQAASDINVTNIAFPDDSAKYWVAVVPHIPGTRLRIDGRFGHMRYFSFNVYDPLIRPVDAIADEALVPDEAGQANPFVEERAPLGGSYTAYVDFGQKPETPAINTLYSGAIPTGDNAVPNPAGTVIMYRSYVPEAGFDFQGGVGLPVLTLETADGSQEILPYADCTEPLIPTGGGVVPDPGLNDLLLTIDLPDALLGLVTIPTATMPPSTQVFYGLPTTLLQILGNALGVPLGEEASGLPLTGGGGFLSNLHNDYTTIGFARRFGSAYVVRARAPSWRGAAGVPWGGEQLRYWSICQNEFLTQRFVDCARDEEVALDESGFFTVMVTDPADRPTWANADNGITWLPWGPFPDGLIIYRHMLPDPGFDQAIQNVPQGTEPAGIMGDYLPIGAYCHDEQLSQAPQSAAALFDDCLHATSGQGAQSGMVFGMQRAGSTPVR